MTASDAVVDVVVEIPTGSRNKYESTMSTTSSVSIAASLPPPRTRPTTALYPTALKSGDPLDALVLVADPTSLDAWCAADPRGLFHA